jgi:cytoskeletal protein CcmA (bactofilin family)
MWFQNKGKHPTIRTIVGEGSTIVGELRFTDGVRIDGEVRGDVIGDAATPTVVVIGEKARIEGKVKARHIIVSGEVRGAVESHELLELRPSISGELRPLDANDRATPVPAALADEIEPAASASG